MSLPNDVTRELWIEHEGARLFALDRGRGEPLVYLHGGLSDHRGSAQHAALFAPSYRFITPDVRGAGRSHFTGALSWDLLARDLLALLDRLGLQRAIIGGSSAGSAIALRFAMRYPQRVTALLLVAPVYAGQERGLVPAQQAAFARMGEAAARAQAEGIDPLLALYAALPEPIRSLATAMASSFDLASVAATTRFLASEQQPFERLAELAFVRVPTVLVPGSDPEHPPELAASYAAALPDARIVDCLARVPEVLRALGT